MIFNEPGFEISGLGAPFCPGVYVVCDAGYMGRKSELTPLYVGSSKNMAKRVYSNTHPYMILFKEFPEKMIVISCIVTDNFLQLERELIAKYQPKHNKKGK
jgi:excinuclease UvrABC nuclease subunit